MTDIGIPALAGAGAGLGVAMPLGAVAALLLREGLVNGFRVAAAAAAGVATVDMLYCAVATLTGAALARIAEDHRGGFMLATGIVLLALAARQLLQGAAATAHMTGETVRASAWAAYGRFAGLTAMNPLTLVYFAALGGAVIVPGSSWVGPVVFVVAAGLSSLACQVVLAAGGSLFKATASDRAVRGIGVAASLIILALGTAAVVNGAAAL